MGRWIAPNRFEAILVLILVMWIASQGTGGVSDWSAACAVFLGFIHSQGSFDAAEGQLGLQGPSVLQRIFIAKEAMWIATFALLGSWPLLAGAVVFISYPALRCWTRPLSGLRSGTRQLSSTRPSNR